MYKVIHMGYKHDEIEALINEMYQNGWKFISLSFNDRRTLGVFEKRDDE